ncbi:MAG: von Willebrand factor type A domain-containing protein, partial [Planctomycetota bacterium]|nr:von Willebrand factor type A domain-containing protein [Planctomycetota bacterium]
VDTASYSNVRRFLNQGRRPPPDAVRIEELLNYFSYDDPAPRGDDPFSVSVEIADAPWNASHRLARIGLKGRAMQRGDFKGSNLVFLLDVSGSMNQPDKLPLLKKAFGMLVEQLGGRDTVSIVVYAGASGTVLEPTSGSDQAAILGALERLHAGGGTNGGAGLRLAYETAKRNRVPGGVNRVILATDGDFNLGTTGKGQLLDLIERYAKDDHIFLTTLGFGYGNLKDDTLEHLANKANGNYAYIDSSREARKVLVEQIGGTLVTIAKDVKIQVEFNPQEIAAYRLIGYENRLLAKEDFNDDTKDAGEIGAGHSVTALYELVPAGALDETAERTPPPVDALRYQKTGDEFRPTRKADSGEAFAVKLRYKQPEGRKSKLLSVPASDVGRALNDASGDFRFAAAVASFGLKLRGSERVADLTWDEIRRIAASGVAGDPGGYRTEFLGLIDRMR